MKKTNVKKLVLAGLFLALGFILPRLTGSIPNIGRMLSPMHIPVLLAGFICGPAWGLAVGAILPLSSHFLFTMPPIGTAVPMTFELAAYGLLAGLLYKLLKEKKFGIILSLVGAMLGGRIIWGIASFVYQRLIGASFTWGAFATGAFVNAVPGIVVQLVLIPTIIYALTKAKLLDN